MKVAAVAASTLLALVLAHEGRAAAECSPLALPSEPVVQVGPAQADELPAIAARAKPGTTMVLADGVYRVPSTIVLAADGVSLRSRSGQPAKVVIDGGYRTGDLIAVAASGVTIAEVTQTPASYFRNPSRFDFHLTAAAKAAIDRGSAVPQSGVDIDGEARGGRPDLGADELTR